MVKLARLLRQAYSSYTGESVNEMIEEAAMWCEQCCSQSSILLRFRAAIPTEKRSFNHELKIDVM